ncbi:MORN repeat-containing protein [Flagellimonas algicola]|uniref:MORN repeat protein n=1 Tax=Flagellimonas algicola TaxID=2583815 RepID=A0ABY2WP98_9FLAO|nr:hypothetical protein [Allomuricauda algicola]TMU56560.1 hypothetical protein FGG15_03200 [Allomuricauda algicola]
MKKRLNQLTYILFGLTFLLGGFYFLKTKNLQEQLNIKNQEIEELANATEIDEPNLSEIDAMIIDGDDYSQALEAYQEKYEEHLLAEEAELKLRIALTQKMMALKAQPKQDDEVMDLQQQLDSLTTLLQTAPKEIQQYDSLNFALEKSKVQIARMQKQLRRKSSGEYLTFTNSKGSLMHYVGQVKDGKANGYGVAILNTGSRYVGEWKDNQRHGEGAFYWADGQHYTGAYVNDKRSGKGTYHWPNGEKFVGLWKDDERMGEGAFYGTKGDVVASGVWQNDELVVTNKP